MFPPELRAKAVELVGRYPVARSALLPLLHLVQHHDGFVSDDGVAECAELLDLSKAEVAAVATFFSMYKRSALGRHLVSVCTNFSCKVRGGQEVYDRLAAKLGVAHNETTADGKVTLEHAECLGNCEGAPVVTVDYMNYECLSPEAAEELVDRVLAGDAPPPTRGLVPPGMRATEYRLAGLGPPDGGIGAPSDQARADDGAVPPREAGPGAPPVAAEPVFAEGQDAERERAKAAVRRAGREPGEVEQEAGHRAREFPTIDPDWQPRRPDAARAAAAPAGTGAVRPEFRDDAGEGDLGAEETGPASLGVDSGGGGAHEYPPASGEGGESAHGEDPRRDDTPGAGTEGGSARGGDRVSGDEGGGPAEDEEGR